MRLGNMKRNLALLGLSLCASLASAQSYPSKAITILVPVPPGGPVDWMARAVGAKLQERWGQSVLVENRPGGAAGWIATQAVQKAAPDGHTLLAHSNTVYSISLFVKDADVRPGVTIQPLAPVALSTYTLLISTSLPVKSAREFIAYAKANPGKLNASSAPHGSEPWVMMHEFIKEAGISPVVVPYPGTPAQQRALLANEAQFALMTPPGPALTQSGKVAILAVTTAKRFSLLPDVPTVKEELGLDIDYSVEFGFFTTMGTPRPAVDKLANEIADIAAQADIRAQVQKMGYESMAMRADEWTRSMQLKEARMRAFVRDAKLKLD